MEYTLNLHGRLMDLSQPQVMGILNVTPDSFYAGSRVQTERDIAARANQIVAEGGSMIDVGGYSTRPGAMEVSEAEEMERLRFGLDVVRRELPYSVISVDTAPFLCNPGTAATGFGREGHYSRSRFRIREDAGTELRGHGRTREVTGHGTAIARRNLPKVDDL